MGTVFPPPTACLSGTNARDILFEKSGGVIPNGSDTDDIFQGFVRREFPVAFRAPRNGISVFCQEYSVPNTQCGIYYGRVAGRGGETFGSFADRKDHLTIDCDECYIIVESSHEFANALTV